MTQQLQFSTYLPLRMSSVLIAEDIGATVFVDFDCNDEPYVSEIWLDNLDGVGVFKVRAGDDLFTDLASEAWEAVRGDVQDAMQEAA